MGVTPPPHHPKLFRRLPVCLHESGISPLQSSRDGFGSNSKQIANKAVIPVCVCGAGHTLSLDELRLMHHQPPPQPHHPTPEVIIHKAKTR